jgi:predicted phage terminase large subunit-like protein
MSLKRLLATSSPLGLAAVSSRGRLTRPPHLALLDSALVKFARRIEARLSPRLLILMPPRHGKSETASCKFPAWLLGQYPDWRVGVGSYGASFASMWGRKVRDLVTTDGHWAGISVRSDSAAADQWLLEGRLGGMWTSGVQGSWTGLGFECIVLDDLTKNVEEANSQVYRDKTWDWYQSTCYTRSEPGGGIVAIGTPWHEDDVLGRIQSSARATGEEWTVIRLPALSEGREVDPLGREAGEPLWAARYDRAALNRIKAVQGNYWFSALYQCAPQPADGGCFKRSWFRYWAPDGDDLFSLSGRPVARRHCRTFLTVDLAFSLKKEADYTVIAAWAVSPKKDLILLDLQRERLEGPDIMRSIGAMYRRHNAGYVGIEDVAAQALVIQAARQAGLVVRSLKADKDKLSRAIPATVRFEAGQIFLPDGAPWLGEYEHELLSFPRGTHDDMVDVTSYAAVEVQRFGGAAEPDEYEKLREEADREIRELKRKEDVNDPSWWEDGGTDQDE